MEGDNLQEIIVGKNDENQRLDRFLLKYLSKAPRGFIYRMIRKKNIELNRKKTKPEEILKAGDKIQLFLADDTIAKFKGDIKITKSDIKLDIVFEDENLILMEKPIGVLSHSDGEEVKGENMVDGLINYLIKKGEYEPKKEHNFKPSLSNRLDRNTSGILIGTKNYNALQSMNKNIRLGRVRRFYLTIIKGSLKEEIRVSNYLKKDTDKNKVTISNKEDEMNKEIVTIIKPIISNGNYTLVEVELITGRTHQIRAHLDYLGYPIIGDRKYGDNMVNKYFKEKYGLENQYLQSYKLKFEELVGNLSYLSNKEIKSLPENIFKDIRKDLFQEVNF